jgi:hypothetical protein
VVVGGGVVVGGVVVGGVVVGGVVVGGVVVGGVVVGGFGAGVRKLPPGELDWLISTGEAAAASRAGENNCG